MSDDGKVPAFPSRIQPLLVLRYSLVRGNACQSYAEEDHAELRKRDIRGRGHSVCAGLPLLAKPALAAARRSRSSHALSHRVSGTDLLQSTSPALELEAAWLVAQRKPSPSYFASSWLPLVINAVKPYSPTKTSTPQLDGCATIRT